MGQDSTAMATNRQKEQTGKIDMSACKFLRFDDLSDSVMNDSDAQSDSEFKSKIPDYSITGQEQSNDWNEHFDGQQETQNLEMVLTPQKQIRSMNVVPDKQMKQAPFQDEDYHSNCNTNAFSLNDNEPLRIQNGFDQFFQNRLNQASIDLEKDKRSIYMKYEPNANSLALEMENLRVNAT